MSRKIASAAISVSVAFGLVGVAPVAAEEVEVVDRSTTTDEIRPVLRRISALPKILPGGKWGPNRAPAVFIPTPAADVSQASRPLAEALRSRARKAREGPFTGS